MMIGRKFRHAIERTDCSEISRPKLLAQKTCDACELLDWAIRKPIPEDDQENPPIEPGADFCRGGRIGGRHKARNGLPDTLFDQNEVRGSEADHRSLRPVIDNRNANV